MAHETQPYSPANTPVKPAWLCGAGRNGGPKKTPKMPENAGEHGKNIREMPENAGKCQEMPGNAGKCRE